ncbi:hypothetical protein J6590_067595 [Homalodisca vitripennis]|nr:hypothetical protein J6590_067595 [Homalodisca vitripennis]
MQVETDRRHKGSRVNCKKESPADYRHNAGWRRASPYGRAQNYSVMDSAQHYRNLSAGPSTNLGAESRFGCGAL